MQTNVVGIRLFKVETEKWWKHVCHVVSLRLLVASVLADNVGTGVVRALHNHKSRFGHHCDVCWVRMDLDFRDTNETDALFILLF